MGVVGHTFDSGGMDLDAAVFELRMWFEMTIGRRCMDTRNYVKGA